MDRPRDFVEALRSELPRWQSEGIVTANAARALVARYGLDGSADRPARDGAPAYAVAAGIAVTLALAVALFASGISDGVLLPIAALAAAFAAGPLAVRGAALDRAAGAVRVHGRLLFCAAAYALSFMPVAEASRFRAGVSSEGLLSALPPFLLGAAAVIVGHRRPDVDAHTRGEAMLLVATVVAFAAGLSLDSGSGTALVATMALAFLSVGRIVRGLSSLSRLPFLEGLLVAAILIASRAFDVFPSFWIAMGFGAGVIVLTVASVIGFEKRRARASDEEEIAQRAA